LEALRTLQVNQCLFGYSDGHCLLASSTRLNSEAESVLLLHSDRAPGLPATSFEAYWTGYPVPSMKAYALMRTWSADEMPRPGCVWSHVILIPFSKLAQIRDLGSLSGYFARPLMRGDSVEYSLPLQIAVPNSRTSQEVVSPYAAQKILHELYDTDANGVVTGLNGDDDPTLFAVWSQQWPRLRRSLSFRTALARESAPISMRFDVRYGDFTKSATLLGGATDAWEAVAIEDLMRPGPFRDFLWKYGPDQMKGRERFVLLGDVFASAYGPGITTSEGVSILDLLVRELPSLEDGKALKAAIVNGAEAGVSIARVDDMALLEYFAATSDRGALPQPNESRLDAVASRWNKEGERVLFLAEAALRNRAELASALVERIAQVGETRALLGQASNMPLVRARLVSTNPAMLDSPELTAISPVELLPLLMDVIDPALASRVVDRLIYTDEPDVAGLLSARFPQEVDRRVFSAWTEHRVRRGPEVPSSWMASITDADHAATLARFLPYVDSFSKLAALFDIVRPTIADGLAIEPVVLASLLDRSPDDLEGPLRQRLFCYLLSLALARPQVGRERLFELTLEPIHSDIVFSKLPQDAFEMLAHHLPKVHWWEEWDTGLRLRRAVVDAYLRNDMDPQSFRKLTRDPSLFDLLIDSVENAKGGKAFIKRMMA
jgi:hypothetical protein